MRKQFIKKYKKGLVMEIVFKTENSNEFTLVSKPFLKDNRDMVSTAIIVSSKLGDPVESIYNDFLFMPTSGYQLPLGWEWTGSEYERK